MLRLVVTAVLLCFASSGLASIQVPTQKPPKPPGIEQEEEKEGKPHFGIWERTQQGRVLHGTRRIPLVPGTEFGWIVDHPGAPGTPVHWREEIVLASAPRYTGGAIRLEPNHLVREMTSTLSDGAFDGTWTLDAWDPRGPATTRIFVAGKLVASFDFVIE